MKKYIYINVQITRTHPIIIGVYDNETIANRELLNTNKREFRANGFVGIDIFRTIKVELNQDCYKALIY